MKLSERIVVQRPVEEVWPFVVSSDQYPLWNSKIVSMEIEGDFQAGQRFLTHYQWKRKALQSETMVTRLIAYELLELHHTPHPANGMPRGMEVLERVRLKARGKRTVVYKEVVFRNHRIPWILRPLLWLVSTFGKPQEPNRLKTLCESAGNFRE